ncbi:hypothetical protein MSAN_01359500 [Mycena sanguinolenta]|uniref:F-box domain-containing protein n=1 Tax=Mycena sanguinolenta TaxID=230812 RepID=A0A8H6YAV5_9AGAR|nr:hypothetical protein MSAN_01359500 [Mycena sanguinolenta]
MQSKADIGRFIEDSDSELGISSLAIDSIPIELLVGIFKLSIHDNTHVEGVFRISQVCSHWRQATHNTPCLWTRPLRVDLRKGRPSQGVYLDGLSSWLGRSVPLPVNLTLLLGSSGISERILEEILKISPRWQCLRLRVAEVLWRPPLSLASLLAECRLDSLEKLDLGREAFSKDINLPAFPHFDNLPRLKSLTICIESSVVCMPWAQLTYLRLECDSPPDDALDTLAQCANLAVASIHISGWESGELTAHRDIITLTNLDTLFLAFSGLNKYVTPFFGCLAAPALATLTLDFSSMYSDMQWTRACFVDFQLRAPNITRLKIYFGDLTPEDLTTALQHAPSLAELELKYCSFFDDAVVSALYCEDVVKPLAPCLHYLVLHLIPKVLTADILAGMLASRWWTDSELATRLDLPAVARWTYLKFTGFRGQLWDRMADLQREGLPIRLR